VKRDYELGFILNPEVNEEQTRAILDRVEQVVATITARLSGLTNGGGVAWDTPLNITATVFMYS